MVWGLVSYQPWKVLLKFENEHAPKTVESNREVLPSKNTRTALVASWKVGKGCLFHRLGLITLMWGAGESLLSLSDCSPPESFPYLSPCDDTAQHHTGSIICEIFSHMRPLMTHYGDNDSPVVPFSCVKIPACENKEEQKEKEKNRKTNIWGFFFYFYLLSFKYPADSDSCLAVFWAFSLSFCGADWRSHRSRLPWQQQEHQRLVI